MKIVSEKLDQYLSDILLSPQCRVYRHIILITVMTIISVYIVINHPASSANFTYLIYVIIGYNISVMTASYINIYILIPRMLLKNNPLVYFLSVVGLVLFFLLVLLILQLVLFDLHLAIAELPWPVFITNLISSMVILGFMIAGITTIVLLKHWNLSVQHIDQLQKASLQSELAILKNQINPHFLFNVINNANVLLKDRQGGASNILLKLEDLLRYQINESARQEILLSSDINFLRDYLNLEKIRRDKFVFDLVINGVPDNLKLPPLMFIPFVENAVKYSKDSDKASYVNISFTMKTDELYFHCENSTPDNGTEYHKPGGLGLKNICRRLELLYPDKHTLYQKQETTKYIVDLHLKTNSY